MKDMQLIDAARLLYSQGDWERAGNLLDRSRAQRIEHPALEKLRAAMQGSPGGRKIFCIGRNKTGTTSLEAALRSLGFSLGLQARGELLIRDWARRDFTRILHLCSTADAFQDVPFSWEGTYRVLDPQFPGSKFVLTVRDTAEQWYESLVSFHTRLVNKGRRPTAEDLKAFSYRYRGYLWEAAQLAFGADEATLYDRELYMAQYTRHNSDAITYFRERPNDLLVLNVAEPRAMERLCSFLGVQYHGQAMPHLNRSTSVGFAVEGNHE